MRNILIKKRIIPSIFSTLFLTMFQVSVFADGSDPNSFSGSSESTTEASANGDNHSSGVQLHDSTNPVVYTGDGYYIPGDTGFDHQETTPEDAERMRSTTYRRNTYDEYGRE